MRRVLAAGGVYFAIVFVAAFALGTVRTLWLEPAIGEMWAVACETPFLIGAMVFGAYEAPRRVKLARETGLLLGMSLFGLLLQQIAEIALVLSASETIAMHLDYLRTPAGMIYAADLVVFVITPLVLWRNGKGADQGSGPRL